MVRSLHLHFFKCLQNWEVSSCCIGIESGSEFELEPELIEMLTTNQFVGLRPAGAQDGGAKMPYPTLSSTLHLFWQRYTVLPPPADTVDTSYASNHHFPRHWPFTPPPPSLHPDAIFLLTTGRLEEYVPSQNKYRI